MKKKLVWFLTVLFFLDVVDFFFVLVVLGDRAVIILRIEN